MNNELNLYKHNKESYQKIKDSFNSGENIVGIVHATGTGKTFNALAFINDNKDKLFLYVVPTLAIVEHVKKVIESLNIENKFTNIRFITYQALSNLNKYDKEELGKNRLCNLDMDYLILDEFHHVGAPVWGDAIDKIVSTHKNLRIFGMSAYTIRDRGTIYERDMAKSSGNELFSDKIVSRYDLVDAMLDQVLPKPIYRSGYVHLSNMAATIEEKLIYSKISSEEKTKYLETLSMAKKRIHESDDISNILKSNLKQDGKYIYFCPMKSIDEVNDKINQSY